MSMEKEALQKLCGSRVQHYRNQRNLTQEELAQKLGTEQNYISQIESGRKMMSAAMLRKMSIALQVSADALLFERSDAVRMQNLFSLLDGQSAKTVEGIEALVRVCLEQFGEPEQSQKEK